MKVLIATGIYPPQIGGPATYTKLLEAELPKHDIEVNVVSFGNVLHLHKGVSHIVYFFQVLAKSFKVDVVYALDPVSVGLPAYVASLISRRRFIVRIVGDYAWEQGTTRFGVTESLDIFSKEHSKYPFFVQILKKIQIFVANHAEKIIVPSKYFRGIISNWGINNKNIYVIYNGVNPNCGSGSKEALRELLQCHGELVISAGRLIPIKNYQALISAISAIRKKLSKIKLVIIGEGPEQKNIEECIRKEKADDYITLTGALAQDVLFQYMRASDLFVLNSIHETFPHVILEAMAAGTPVVATMTGGIPEIIENKKNGLLVPVDDVEKLRKTIIEVLTTRSLSARLASGGKERISHFTEKKLIEKTIKLLKKT